MLTVQVEVGFLHVGRRGRLKTCEQEDVCMGSFFSQRVFTLAFSGLSFKFKSVVIPCSLTTAVVIQLCNERTTIQCQEVAFIRVGHLGHKEPVFFLHALFPTDVRSYMFRVLGVKYPELTSDLLQGQPALHAHYP